MSYRLNEGAVLEDIDSELVIVTDNGDAAVMNETAGVVLQELLLQKDAGEIARTLAADYDIDVKVVENDLQSFFDELIEKELLQRD